jgi:hypothetical protein
MFLQDGPSISCQHQIVSTAEIDHLCHDFARVEVNPFDANYRIIFQWTEIYDQVTQVFEDLMRKCANSLRSVKDMMESSILQEHSRLNAVFSEWWTERIDEIRRLEELLHNQEVIVSPTIRNVLSYIAQQVPRGKRVQVDTNIDGHYRTICILIRGDVQIVDGQVVAEIEERWSAPAVSLLLERMTL